MDKKRKKQLAYLLAARMSIPFDDFRSIRNESIANFIATDDTRIMKLLVGIDPVQSGSGDPSPDNVRPISGWTGMAVYRMGKNLLNRADDLPGYISADGTISGETDPRYCHSALIPVTQGSVCYVRGFTLLVNYKRLHGYDENGTWVQQLDHVDQAPANSNYVLSATIPNGIAYVSLSYAYSDENVYIFDGKTYPVSWQSEAGTVYGGTLDVVSGLLTATHANIASYDGENINEPWISSMDVYSSGGTPTTGAQVVYPLATPQTYQLDPVNIQPLLGENNIWANTGYILILDLNY